MSKIIESNLPCPCQQSSDAYVLYEDGSGYCYSGKCGGTYFRNDGVSNKEIEVQDNIEERYIPHRGITEQTLKKFGVKVLVDTTTDEPIRVGFFYPNKSVKSCKWDVKGKDPNKWRTVGDISSAHLFGKNIFDKGSKRVLTITEGEYDTLSVWEMIGPETAVTSIKSSVTAFSDCKEEYEYINSFEKIVINMDNDEAGQKAAKKIASLFDFKKVYNLCLNKYKDANDYLTNNDSKAYLEAWRGVKRYTPDNLLSTFSQFSQALRERREECIATYPFEQLQSALHGLHGGEVVVIKAPPGTGKTEVFRAIENHVLKTTKLPVGILHLEEDNGTTLRAMAGYYSQKPLLHPDMPAPDEEVEAILKEILGDDEERVLLHSSFDVEDEDAFLANIRFMVSGGGCRIIFFDHISWLATGTTKGENDDERKKLDRIMQRLKLLAKELNFCLVMISHVNDNGETRGSRNIQMAANTIIVLKRDKMNADEQERLKTYLLVEKARLIGAREGPAGYALYDQDKLMLIDPYDQQLELPV